jgi:phosphatidylglycerophosphate synthase
MLMDHAKLPNRITMARLVLSIIFFILLALSDAWPAPDSGLLLASFVLYIVAGLTDILDGYLARKWEVTSAFGRIADPFVDKVIVCGGFALLAGRNFAYTDLSALDGPIASIPYWLHGGMASGVQGWMVVVLIAREFIVSGIRGFSESRGVAFPASPAGKIKMFVQSFALCTALYQMAFLPNVMWALVMKISLVWATVIITVLSGLAYVGKARKLLVEATVG